MKKFTRIIKGLNGNKMIKIISLIAMLLPALLPLSNASTGVFFILALWYTGVFLLLSLTILESKQC